MHEIKMSEPSSDFGQMWTAAMTHINDQIDGGLQSWLKSRMEPPFLDHFSFRLKNQIFFVQIEDSDRLVETPGNHNGLRHLAAQANGHACLMPMSRTTEGWAPSKPNWGLIGLDDGLLINPLELTTDDLIELTDWEIGNWGVQIVRDWLRDQGHQVMSSHYAENVYPNIWFVSEHGPEWVIVRTVRHPIQEAELPDNCHEIARNCARISDRGHFAPLRLVPMSTAFTDDVGQPIWRNHAAQVDFSGLIALERLN